MRDCSRIPDAAVTRFVSDRAPGERVLNTKMCPCVCVYVRSRKQVSVAAGRCHSSFGNRLKFAKHRRSTILFRLIINTSMSCRGKRPKRVLSGPFSVTLRRTPAGCVCGINGARGRDGKIEGRSQNWWRRNGTDRSKPARTENNNWSNVYQEGLIFSTSLSLSLSLSFCFHFHLRYGSRRVVGMGGFAATYDRGTAISLPLCARSYVLCAV